jgi:N-terminal acetyltransferase B complex non-catalytic subunit
MAYVRIGDFKKQQITARNLYKIKSKNPYYFWGVMSVVMQAREVTEQVARSVTLPVAERMVVKMIESGKVEAEQEVQLYLMILEMQVRSYYLSSCVKY